MSICMIFQCLLFHNLSMKCCMHLKLIMAQSTLNTTAPHIPLTLLGQRVEMRLRGNGLFNSGFPGCSTAISLIRALPVCMCFIIRIQQSPYMHWPVSLQHNITFMSKYTLKKLVYDLLFPLRNCKLILQTIPKKLQVTR